MPLTFFFFFQELAHYALATTDLEFKFPFGWEELWGIANRGDFDLKAHSLGANRDLQYTVPGTKEVRSERIWKRNISAVGGGAQLSSLGNSRALPFPKT